MKTNQVAPYSLCLGVVLGLAAFLAMAQVAPQSSASWGPPKKGIVNIFEATPVVIPVGGIHVVHQVPQNSWVTITAAVADGPESSHSKVWSEILGGVATDRGFATPRVTLLGYSQGDVHSLFVTPELAGGTVGWVFRPGSQIAIRNTGIADVTLSKYALIGYETRD